MMQTAGVTSEFRSQYTGHELSDEHHSTYSRKYTPRELAAQVHPALDFKLDIAGIADVMSMRLSKRTDRA